MSTQVSRLAAKLAADRDPSTVLTQTLAENSELTAAQVQLLNAQGFLSLNPIATPQEIHVIRTALPDLSTSTPAKTKGPISTSLPAIIPKLSRPRRRSSTR